METSYRELKCKYVVNIGDGKNLGKTCDIVFTFPEGRVIGIAVPAKAASAFSAAKTCSSPCAISSRSAQTWCWSI